MLFSSALPRGAKTSLETIARRIKESKVFVDERIGNDDRQESESETCQKMISRGTNPKLHFVYDRMQEREKSEKPKKDERKNFAKYAKLRERFNYRDQT